MNREQLNKLNKEQLIDTIVALEEQLERGKNILAYYERKHGISKFADVTPERVAKLHIQGYSLADIKRMLDNEFIRLGVKDTDGRQLTISLQTLSYKIKKYEKDNNVSIYRVGTKGRKKKK